MEKLYITGAALFLSATVPVYAQTIPLPTGETVNLGSSGITANLASTATGGVAIRTSNPDPTLIGSSFGSNGKPKGGVTTGDATDNGDINYRKGDVFDAPIKLFSRLTLTDGAYSVVVSTRAWVDPALETGDVSNGNGPNGFQYNQPLGDNGLTQLNKFANIVPWEAYATAKWPLGKDALTVSVGREAVDWSKALYFIDYAHIAPFDITALNEPGALTDREVNIPTGLLSAKYKLAAGLSVEGFYQLEQREDNLPACGTFSSVVNIGVDPGCAGVTDNAFTSVNAKYLPASAAVWDTASYSLANGDVIPRIGDTTPGAHEQGGVAVRYHLAPANLDMSLYFLNLESRLPFVAVNTDVNPSASKAPNAGLLAAGAPVGYAGLATVLKNQSYHYDYPGNIRTVGFNAATTLLGWKVAGEVEYIDNQPLQVNTPDILSAVLGAPNLIANRLQPGTNATFKSVDQHHEATVDVNFIRVLPHVLRARALVLLAEFRYQGVMDLPPLSEVRYGRSFAFGSSADGTQGCLATESPQAQDISGCFNKGFVTSNAVAYRLRAALSYAVGSGFSVSPSLLWSHDVSGYSADGQILQNRRIIKAAVDWAWKKKVFGGVSAVYQVNASTYNVQRDRDYVELYAGVNF